MRCSDDSTSDGSTSSGDPTSAINASASVAFAFYVLAAERRLVADRLALRVRVLAAHAVDLLAREGNAVEEDLARGPVVAKWVVRRDAAFVAEK